MRFILYVLLVVVGTKRSACLTDDVSDNDDINEIDDVEESSSDRASKTDPHVLIDGNTTLAEIFENAVQAYLEEDWNQCIARFNDALHGYEIVFLFALLLSFSFSAFPRKMVVVFVS